MAWEAWFAVGLIIRIMVSELATEDTGDLRKAITLALGAAGILCVVLL